MKWCVLTPFLLLALCASATAGELTPGLQALIEGRPESGVVRALVVLRDRPDVPGLARDLARGGVRAGERHARVVNALQEAATRAQPRVLADLEARRISGGIRGYRAHWLVNGIVVTGTVAEVRRLARRGDVERVEPDLEVELIEPVASKTAAPLPRVQSGLITPGVIAVGAPRVWSELGLDGAGTIVANMDSGVDGSHPALASRWRGNFVPAAQAWLDQANVGSPGFPVDPYGHGTHVMGTITGTTNFETVGVAPGAQWIATNSIASSSEGFDNAVLAGFEWLADPDGDPNTQDDVPDVVQNSWGVAPYLGDYLECDSTWWEVIDNCEAAGVVVVFSAGNDGPGPGSLRSPGNRATSATNAFSVGSTTTYEPFALSYFSSRGPSQCGGEFSMKPEVSAPGSDILSSVPGGGYAYLSGTSMAGPHVAGVVALMRQANPDVDVATIKEILMETARDLGAAGEDNDYGHGLVDAYAAVMTVLDGVGSISGTITDASSGLPLVGARIRDLGGSTASTVGPDGSFAFTMRSGARTFEISKFGYQPKTLEVVIPAGGAVVQDVVVTPTPWATIAGTARGPDGAPVPGAVIVVLDTPVAPLVADGVGAYSISLPAGPGFEYTLRATAPGLAYDLRYTGLNGDVALDFQLPLVRGDGFESGDLGTLAWGDAGEVAWSIDPGEAQTGGTSARSGSIGHGQSSRLTLDYYVNGDGPFSFWLMVESEVAYDRLEFSIDGGVVGTWSGQVPWTRFEQQLGTGLHHFEWVYRKDGSVTVPRDAAWIDEVSLPGTGIQPFPDMQLPASAFEFTSTNAAPETFLIPLVNAGSFQLEYDAWIEDPEDGTRPDWIDVGNPAGRISPGGGDDLELVVDGYRAGVGVHAAQLWLRTNDPGQSEVFVELTVGIDGVTAVGPTPGKRTGLISVTPNPFNPATEISYSLERDGPVSLVVYDVAGRNVRTLVDRSEAAGIHRVRWDGRDRFGRGVSSGIYYARFRAGGIAASRPLTLVR